jgi:hypothetical protein
MNYFKLILVAGTLLVTSALTAQNSKAIEESSQAVVKQIAQVVDLTDEQQTLIYRQVMTHKSNEAKAQANPTEDMKAKLAKSEEMMMSNIENILGKENYEKAQKILVKESKSKSAITPATQSTIKSK